MNNSVDVVTSVTCQLAMSHVLFISDHTVFNLSPHTGIIVLMLSRLLPVSWQCHNVVSDHTAPIIYIKMLILYVYKKRGLVSKN